MQHPTRAEIRLQNIVHNLEEIREKAGPDTKVLAAVKANAYGHGAVQVSEALAAHGVDMLGIAAISEAIELREAGFETPMLMLGSVVPDLVEDALTHAVALTVCDTGLVTTIAETAKRLGVTASIHVKVDTGMGRIGASPDSALDLVRHILSLDDVSFDGIWTHFPTADEADLTFAKEQIAVFNGIVEEMKKEGMPVPLRHAANSGAIAQLPDAHFDMVRPGLALYGYHPTADMTLDMDLRPGMTLKTHVSFIKDLPAGVTVSYGRTFTTSRPTRAATLPIGYADGLNRLLSNMGHVLICGKRAPIIGRICMDQCVADVTDVPDVQVGEPVVVYGQQGDEMISIESVAKTLGTIPNEVVCAVSKRVPRVHLW